MVQRQNHIVPIAPVKYATGMATESTEDYFDRMSLVVMKALAVADPGMGPTEVFGTLLKCICDGILRSDTTDENKIGAANDMAERLVQWTTMGVTNGK